MTSYNDVPFDDNFALLAPAWYENPYLYGAGIATVVISVGIWFAWRWYTNRASQSDRDAHSVRSPAYWADRLYTATVVDDQQPIYADFLVYIKYIIGKQYHISGRSLTDAELAQWAWEHLDREYARHVQTIVEHAEHVRFQGESVDTQTLCNDYMIVNQVASYMEKSQ